MNLSSDLISQFVKTTNDDKKKVSSEATFFGTIVEYDGSYYAKLDGSEQLTPITTTADVVPGERVTVLLKNHSATVTGNITSPSARQSSVVALDGKVTQFGTVLADKVDTVVLRAEQARIDELYAENATITGKLTANEASIKTLEADNVTIKETLTANSASIGTLEADNVTIKETLTANSASIETLEADNVTINETLTANSASIKTLEADNVTINETLTAQKASIENLEADKLSATEASILYATIENLNASNARITYLEGDYGEFKALTATNFEATNAYIENLEANKLSATDADLKYANIDFTNIGKAAMEYFYANSGLIKDVTISDGTITGNLIGVTISGDLIEGNTIVAEKLVIKGTDGLYYKLNTDGVTTEAEQTDYNSLNGTIIKAKSVTASKVSVDDLVAFDATIGGFTITESSLYSGAKASADNSTRGVYLDSTGQVNFGDSNNYLKYFKDSDGTYKLAISADTITFGSGNTSVETAIDAAKTLASTAVTNAASAQSTANTANSTANTALTNANAAQEDIDNLEIGGRNLVLQSKDFTTGDEYWTISSAFTKSIDDNGFTVISASRTGVTSAWWSRAIPHAYIQASDMHKGITVSFDFKCDDYSILDSGIICALQTYDETDTRIGWYETINILTGVNITCDKTPTDGEWVRASIYFSETNLKTHNNPDSAYTEDDVSYANISFNLVKNGSIHFRKVKVEYGNKATDWTPAPEDVDVATEAAQTTADEAKEAAATAQNGVDSLTTRVTAAETSITQNKEAIELRATKTEVTTVSNTASTALTNAETAQSTANTALSNAATAQSAAEAAQEDVDKVETRVTNAETKITQNAESITSVASRTTAVENKFGEYSTTEEMNSAIEQKADSITSTVSSTYATKAALAVTNTNVTNAQAAADAAQEDIDNLEIGGANLIRNSRDMSTYYKSSNVTLSEDNEGFTVATFAAVDTLAWNNVRFIPPIEYSVVRNKTVTFSLYVRSDDYEELNAASGGIYVCFNLCTSSSTTRTLYAGATLLAGEMSDEWVKLTCTKNLADSAFNGGSGDIDDTTRFYMSVYNHNLYSMQIKKPKLEIGNKATDWTPAPEDIEERVLSAESSITQLSDKITANVTETTSLATRMSTVEQTASGLTVTLSEVQTELDNLEISSRNILLNSGEEITTTNYLLKSYTPSKTVAANTDYTVVVKANIPTTHQLRVYVGQTSSIVVAFNGTGQDEIYTMQFTSPSNTIVSQYVRFYSNVTGTNTSSDTSRTLYWACLYEGHVKATLDWIAAPEDTDSAIATAQDTADAAQSTATSAQSSANVAQATADAAKKQVYHKAAGTSGTSGYVGFATLTISGTYQNAPIRFELVNRSQISSNVIICFANLNGTDPSLSYIKRDGGISVWAYKSTTSTWILIAQKSEAYDTICVSDYANPYNSSVSVDWTNVFYTSLPTSNITAATVLAGKIDKSVVDNAAKTATNYLNFSSSGLCIGDMTASTLGRNVLIDSDSVDIRSGTTVVASYGDEYIYLGKNSEDTIISFCSNRGRINVTNDDVYGTYFNIDVDENMSIYAPKRFYTSSYMDNGGTVSAGASIEQTIDISNSENYMGYLSMMAYSQNTSAGTYFDTMFNVHPSGVDLWSTEGETGYTVGFSTSASSNKIDILGDSLNLQNTSVLRGYKTDGSTTLAIAYVSSSNNVVLGYGTYAAGSGSTNVYGNTIKFYVKSPSTSYVPYYKAGDSVAISGIYTAGFLTSSNATVYYMISLDKPLLGSPTISISTTTGYILRQSGYTHGSDSSTRVTPASTTARHCGGGIFRITATFSDTTNSTNNAPIGINCAITLTFS